ncbi:transposase [Candidatus Kaiserbacteria bacterium]|nr:transposase [Candidatus Kaiserbacteria bacterium]
MRKEPYGVDSFVHVMKRGARGLPVTSDLADCWRFARLLYHMNDEYKSDTWERDTFGMGIFERPSSWPERRPLVKVLAWVLMPNHFHLVLKEINEGGVSKYMQKIGNSMTAHFNLKYEEKGSIFQGAFKSRTLDDDFYLKHVAPYVMVKNVFELYPGGYDLAVSEFDNAWKWAVEEYPFSSLADYAIGRMSPIIEKDIFGELFDSLDAFKVHAKEMILNRVVESDNNLYAAALE